MSNRTSSRMYNLWNEGHCKCVVYILIPEYSHEVAMQVVVVPGHHFSEYNKTLSVNRNYSNTVASVVL